MPRRLGQHFLHDPAVVARIVKTLELSRDDHVVEIGPGRGVLTRELTARAGRVTAIELDSTLASALAARFAGHPRVRIIQADALDLEPCDLVANGGVDRSIESPDAESDWPPVDVSSYKLAGNIPYYITGALIRRYVDTHCKPSLAVLMLQLEVALRMIAKPGEMSLLAIAVQLYAEPSIVLRVPRTSFSPKPKVESAVVRLAMLPGPRVPVPNAQDFFNVARAGFSTKRKQLANALANGLAISKPVSQKLLEGAGIEMTQRAEDLGLDEWCRLAWAWSEHRPRSTA